MNQLKMGVTVLLTFYRLHGRLQVVYMVEEEAQVSCCACGSTHWESLQKPCTQALWWVGLFEQLQANC